MLNSGRVANDALRGVSTARVVRRVSKAYQVSLCAGHCHCNTLSTIILDIKQDPRAYRLTVFCPSKTQPHAKEYLAFSMAPSLTQSYDLHSHWIARER